MNDLKSIEQVAAHLSQAKHLAILTGAGISAESGIPTFRDALTGLWERFDAADLATADAYRRDKELVWGWYEWRRMKVLLSEPNPGHVAIARLAELLPQCTLITQNVDDLHERAGSRDVLHVHGSLHAPRCFACARPFSFPDGVPVEPEGGRRLKPPVCAHCGGYIRPGVVWFNECLSPDIWEAADHAIRICDVLLTIGTSGMVYPAASLPALAQRLGKTVIVINPNATEQDHYATHCLRGPAGQVLPALVGMLD
ncbi:MAG: NAD-dependent deacylase [Nitrosomonas ureae]